MKVVTPNGDFDLGATEETPTISFTDFSRRVTDDFGVTTIVERGFSRRMSVKLALPFDTVDTVHRRLSDLRAASALWVADPRFVWLSLYGFYKDFEVDLATPPLSTCTLTVDGLAETGGVTDNGVDPALGRASTFQMLQPLQITDAVLAGSNVPESDAPEWASGSGYGKGARVIRASTHRVYESLLVGNAGKTPESEPAWWLDVGPTNRWAMFDQALGTATTRNGGVEVTLNGGAANAVSVLDVVGDSVRVRANGYDQTQPVLPGAITFTGLPGSGQVIITISGAQAAAGTLLIGRMVGLGVTEAAPTAGITDFSRKVTDDFGAVTVVERGFAKRMSARALIRTDAVDIVADRLASVRARPSLWIGYSGLDAITVYGFIKDFEITVGTTASKLSLTVEGLTKAAPIATGVPQLVPRGPYDPATIYAAGALVEDQGVTWRYINATPTSGYAPPKLPTTRNGFWQVFSSVGMTPEQQAAYDKLLAAITAITSDNIIAAGGEKNQIIQLYEQLADQSIKAHTASVQLDQIYGGDPTGPQRQERNVRVGELNGYLASLAPPWNDPNVNTPVDGSSLRMRFTNAQAAVNALIEANSAYVRDRTKAAMDRIAAIGADDVLSAGSEKQQTLIDYAALYNDYAALKGRFADLGSPGDILPSVQAMDASWSTLNVYLNGLNPRWDARTVDTPIVSADWQNKWGDAYQKVATCRAAITGRKGDKGDKGDQGVGLPGEPGKDGQTWYPYFAYANSPDGAVDFTTGAPGTRAYVGTATGTSPTEPTLPGLYIWSEYKGPPFGIATRGQAVVAGRMIVKQGGPGDWQSDAYSTVGFNAGAVTSFQFAGGSSAMAGLNTDPTADASFTSLDFAWYAAGDGICRIYESGVNIGAFGTFNDATKFQLHYDGQFIRYYKDGALARGPLDVGRGRTYYFDSSLAAPGSRITNIDFASAGEVGEKGDKGDKGNDSTVPGPAGKPALSLTSSAPSLTFAADYLGNLKSGQLAQVIVLSFLEGATNVSTSVDWSSPEFSGCTGQMTSAGLITFNTVTANGYVRVNGTYKGVTLQVNVPIVLSRDAPPANSDQQASIGTNGFTIGTNTYPAAPLVTITASVPGGTLRGRMDVNYSAGGQGNVYLEGMLGYRVAGSNNAWTFLPAVQGSQARINNNNPQEPINDQGYFSSNQTAAVGAGRYEVGIFLRRYQGSQSGITDGRFQASNG